MPSTLHETLLQLFRNRPELAPELLREALHVDLPPYSEARVESADFTEVQPTEYRADLVVLLYNDQPVLGIVVEVQLGRNDDKRYAWPVYAVGLRARMRCPVCVLVFTPHHELVRWASRLAMLPLVAIYALVVYFTQYLSWYGVWSLYEQHAFGVPAPFLGM